MEDENINILIVDDNENDLYLIKRKLLEHFPKATFTMAHSYKEFIDKLPWVDHDIIISDYELRGNTGLELLLYLRENQPDIPFVFVTGMLNSDSKTAQAILSGASGFVLKDELEDLPDTVKNVLNQVANGKKEQASQLELLNNCHLKLQQLQAYLAESTFDKKMNCLDIVREVETLLNDVKK